MDPVFGPGSPVRPIFSSASKFNALSGMGVDLRFQKLKCGSNERKVFLLWKAKTRRDWLSRLRRDAAVKKKEGHEETSG